MNENQERRESRKQQQLCKVPNGKTVTLINILLIKFISIGFLQYAESKVGNVMSVKGPLDSSAASATTVTNNLDMPDAPKLST